MKSDEPTKPTDNEEIKKVIKEDNLSDEQFEDKLAEELRKKREKELDENQIFALRNCI